MTKAVFLLQLYHIKGQVEEVETIESDVFHRFSKILDAFENSTNHRSSDETTTSHLSPEDEKMFNKITDLIKVINSTTFVIKWFTLKYIWYTLKYFFILKPLTIGMTTSP